MRPPSNTLIYLLVFLLAILVDLILISQWRRRRGSVPTPERGSLLRAPSPILAFLRRLFSAIGAKIPLKRLKAPPLVHALFERAVRLAGADGLGTPLELALIVVWAAWVSSPLLNTLPTEVPKGGEFSNLTQTHYIWTLLPRCGLCFLWNGSINGGAPAFAELTGAVLHPLVFIPVLIWGVVQGAKVTYFASLALAGMAQWGLARKLRLGMWPRMWSGLLVVVGGHLAGKMENGDVGLVLGLACAALALTFGVDLLFNRNRKALVWFALALALTLLSGEGYIQIAVALTLLPTLALFCFTQGKENGPAWKDYLLALGLALLFCGLFLAPLLHLLPWITKDSDPSLSNFPPLEYLPLNLIIRDVDFHRSAILGKDPYLATHLIYIGWTPVLLALLALRFLPARLNRLLWIFMTGIVLVFLITSIDLPRLLSKPMPIVASLRHLTVASGLVVPLIVGLASASLDEILRRLTAWLRSGALFAAFSPASRYALSALPYLLGMLPLAVLSIYPCYTLSQVFLGVRDLGYLNEPMQRFQTPSAQWIQPPYGFFDWTAQALSRGYKISHTWRPWYLRSYASPEPYAEAVYMPKYRLDQKPDQVVREYGFIQHPEREYAQVSVPGAGAAQACQASSQGGWIDIDCQNDQPGILTVRENALDSWYAWTDGKPARMASGQWLSVAAPAGSHHYRFRYLPWDALAGLLLTVLGTFLAIRFTLRNGI